MNPIPSGSLVRIGEGGGGGEVMVTFYLGGANPDIVYPHIFMFCNYLRGEHGIFLYFLGLLTQISAGYIYVIRNYINIKCLHVLIFKFGSGNPKMPEFKY